MVDSFDAFANRIVVVQNDHVVFDTNNKSVNLFPEAYAIRRTNALGNPLVVDFPDLLKVNAHWRQNVSGGLSECRSFTSLIYQEWGPNESNADDWWFPMNPTSPAVPNLESNFRNLPTQYVGSVPAGTDYIDIRMNLVNTQVPTPILGVPIFTHFTSGQWTGGQGYAFPIELQDPLARMFQFRLVGTDVYMDRFQSVRRYQQVSWLPNNDDTAASGWTYGDTTYRPDFWLPTSSGQPHADLGLLAYEIEHKGPDGNGAKRRRVAGSNACSVVDVTNYRSVWQGDLIIRPGRRT